MKKIKTIAPADCDWAWAVAGVIVAALAVAGLIYFNRLGC
jgi:hypothetical protein